MALITEQDDRTLVEQHRAGDDDAFRAIVLRHHRSLYANALRRLGDPVLAEDAVQEAFLRAFRNLGRFNGEYHLDAWLHRIVTNTCHDIGRRQGRDTRLFDRACTRVELASPPADDDLEAAPRTDVSDALDSLPASYREVLLLRFVEELSYSDVAEKAGISEENARARVSRGRNMLKRMLTSTSALVVWAIPPLRRTQLTDADAAAHGAQHVSGITNVAAAVQTTPGIGRLTDLAAQAGPTIATAAPTVTSSGPAVKAAVAAGLAAAVAIPTGVAVDRAREKPTPQPVAPLVVADEDEVAAPGDPVVTEKQAKTGEAAPSTAGSATVGPLSSSTATPTDVQSAATAPDADATTVDATASTSTSSSTSTSTTKPPAETTPPPTTVSEEESKPVEEAAPVAQAGQLSADGLTVTEEGPRLAVSGRFALVLGDETLHGTLTGKPYIGEADPKDPRAPREFYDSFELTLDDGRVLQLRFNGTAVVSEQGKNATFELTLRFGLTGGAELGLEESGTLTGTFERRGGSGSLALSLPGARSGS